VVERLAARWPDVVGQTFAHHCEPRRLGDDGTLTVLADSAAWATHLCYLQEPVLERLAGIVGAGVINQVRVRTSPSTWPWSQATR
jgi:predicted nucleic acid-binding Zn ribbon protein